jgi:hypothetical protein
MLLVWSGALRPFVLPGILFGHRIRMEARELMGPGRRIGRPSVTLVSTITERRRLWHRKREIWHVVHFQPNCRTQSLLSLASGP